MYNEQISNHNLHYMLIIFESSYKMLSVPRVAAGQGFHVFAADVGWAKNKLC